MDIVPNDRLSQNEQETSWSAEADGDLFVRKHFWVIRLKLSPAASVVYDALGLYANFKSGHAHPCIETLCKETGFSASTVKRAIKELEERGAIIVTRTVTQRGRHSHYRLPRDPHGSSVNFARVMGDPCASVTSDLITRTSINKNQITNILEDSQKTALTNAYPKRDGAVMMKQALAKIESKIKSGSVTYEEVLRGFQAYAMKMRESGKERTEYVMQATKFVNNELWTEYQETPEIVSGVLPTLRSKEEIASLTTPKEGAR